MLRRFPVVIVAAILLAFQGPDVAANDHLTVFERAASLNDEAKLDVAIQAVLAVGADGKAQADLYRSLELALAHMSDKNDIDTAIKRLRDAVGLHPESATLWMLLSDAYNSRLNVVGMFGKPRAARDVRDALEAVVRFEPAHAQALQYLATYYANAPKIAGGDSARANEMLDRLHHVDRSRWLYAKALIAKHDGNDPAAAGFYLDAVREAPDYEQLYVNAALHLEEMGRMGEALSVLRAGYEHVLEPRELLYQIGKLAAKTQSSCDTGLTAIQRYVEIPSVFRDIPAAWVMFRRGQLHHCMEDDQSAMQDYREALRLDPKLDEVHAAMERLANAKPG